MSGINATALSISEIAIALTACGIETLLLLVIIDCLTQRIQSEFGCIVIP